ncbi:MAG TPA: zf-TFIIB domain-containing protein [Acidimicrobiales bacterium]|nr:zf-TFIIB domain-containing protein [Acidimicrobiales bacterium]
MNCPVDNETLQMTERSGVEVDYCPRCRGVWLDRGELDKILERAEREIPVPMTMTGRLRDDYDREDDRRRDHDDDDDYHRRDSYGRPYKKRRKNFLSEMFEFGD